MGCSPGATVGCTNRISVGINDRILTEYLSTINEGIPLSYYVRASLSCD
jgi:hypothetical protein